MTEAERAAFRRGYLRAALDFAADATGDYFRCRIAEWSEFDPAACQSALQGREAASAPDGAGQAPEATSDAVVGSVGLLYEPGDVVRMENGGPWRCSGSAWLP